MESVRARVGDWVNVDHSLACSSLELVERAIDCAQSMECQADTPCIDPRSLSRVQLPSSPPSTRSGGSRRTSDYGNVSERTPVSRTSEGIFEIREETSWLSSSLMFEVLCKIGTSRSRVCVSRSVSSVGDEVRAASA